MRNLRPVGRRQILSVPGDKYQRLKTSPSAEVALAMDRCLAGHPAEAIPTLESALRDSNVDLPPKIKPVRGRGS